MIINGIKCTTIEEVEAQIVSLSQEQKQIIINDFLGIVNTPIQSIPSVTPRQIRIALILSNISLSVIENMIESLPEPQKSIAHATWEYSTEIQRNNPILNAIAPSLGFTSQQLDEFFILAATL